MAARSWPSFFCLLMIRMIRSKTRLRGSDEPPLCPRADHGGHGGLVEPGTGRARGTGRGGRAGQEAGRAGRAGRSGRGRAWGEPGRARALAPGLGPGSNSHERPRHNEIHGVQIFDPQIEHVSMWSNHVVFFLGMDLQFVAACVFVLIVIIWSYIYVCLSVRLCFVLLLAFCMSILYTTFKMSILYKH